MTRPTHARRTLTLLVALLAATTFACGGDDGGDAAGSSGTGNAPAAADGTAGDQGSSAGRGADDHCSLMTNAEMREIADAASVSSKDTTSNPRVVFCRFEFGLDDDALEVGNGAYVDVGLTRPRRGNDDAAEEMAGYLHCGGKFAGSDEIVTCEAIDDLGDAAQIALWDGNATIGVVRGSELLEVQVQNADDPQAGISADSRTIAEAVARLAFGRLP